MRLEKCTTYRSLERSPRHRDSWVVGKAHNSTSRQSNGRRVAMKNHGLRGHENHVRNRLDMTSCLFATWTLEDVQTAAAQWRPREPHHSCARTEHGASARTPAASPTPTVPVLTRTHSTLARRSASRVQSVRPVGVACKLHMGISLLH